MTVRIVVAGDHELMRKGLCALLATRQGVEVAAEAVRLVRQQRPDVVLMDITMPVLDGIEATRHIVAESPGTGVIALAMHADRALKGEMRRAGAAACVDCRTDLDALFETIHAVARKKADARPGRRRGAGNGPMPPRMTPRERQVLSLIGGGHNNATIAQRLSLRPKTVETHRMHIMLKLDLHTTAALTRYAVIRGLASA